tara:strand:- start:30 stop:251 length:222 start_codon:yes stop_codon:yes gene_type:complete
MNENYSVDETERIKYLKGDKVHCTINNPYPQSKAEFLIFPNIMPNGDLVDINLPKDVDIKYKRINNQIYQYIR